MTAEELGRQPVFPGTLGDTEDAGLTKLELFTALAMAGLLAGFKGESAKSYGEFAQAALTYAQVQLDALATKAATP